MNGGPSHYLSNYNDQSREMANKQKLTKSGTQPLNVDLTIEHVDDDAQAMHLHLMNINNQNKHMYNL